jgi:hypothetical protein
MKTLVRALARFFAILVLVAAAMMAAFALLPVYVRWPVRREDEIVEVMRAEDAPVSPAPNLEVRR